MLHKISILALLSLAVAFLVVAPANADGVPAHLTADLERDADSVPHYSHDVHIDGKLKPDVFKGEDADFKHGLHDFSSGVPNTAEWIWWLNHHSDTKEFSTDPPLVTAPEPASLLLLCSGVLALGAWRRRANHSAPIS
jgi:hypothetical protein